MLKKHITVAVIGLLFFNVAFAQTDISASQDLLNLIRQLQAQIQSLQAQIVDLQTEVQSVKLELKFNRALAQGATGDDVKQLQEFLKNFTGSYPDGSITGYFGPRTAAAVKNFQAQNGIASVGVVGPQTQNKLNVLAAAIPAATPCINCSPTATALVPVPTAQATPAIPSQDIGISATPVQPISQTTTQPTRPSMPSAVPGGIGIPATPATLCKTPVGVQIKPDVITVLSPNGGEQWQIGGTYTIKYSAKDTIGNKALLIYLEKGYDAPTTKTGANSSLLIGVTTNLESYTYTVPSNTQAYPGLGSNYKITIMVEGSYFSCDRISYSGDSSDTEFSIVAGQVNVSAATPTVTTTSGGGYGVSTAPVPVTPTTVSTQDKINAILAEISKLQNQLDTTTDTVARAHLPAQITALRGQLQIVPLSAQIDTLHTKLEKATDDETETSLRSQIDALKAQVAAILSQTQLKPIYVVPPPAVALTTQEKISGMRAQISAYQNKLDNTTDASVRDNLTTQIVTLKKIIQELQNSPTTPSIQPALSTPSVSASTPAPIPTTSISTPTTSATSVSASASATAPAVPVPTAPATPSMPATPTTSAAQTTTASSVTSAAQNNIDILITQINALANKLNSTTDTATRDSLMLQIVALKAQVQKLQGN